MDQKDEKSPLILVVDDEEDLANLLSFNLEKEGYRVACAYEGYQAVDMAVSLVPDLIILDIMLPGIDGLEVCRRIRGFEEIALVPIMMLSARKEEIDKVLGLEMGADDYVSKPFGIREIVARVRAILRRNEREGAAKIDVKEVKSVPEDILQVGNIILYPERYSLVVDGTKCVLSHKEFELLRILMENAGRVINREQLLERVWGIDNFDVDTRTVDVHIRYLRKKIEKDPSEPLYIKTIRGVGYRFEKADL